MQTLERGLKMVEIHDTIVGFQDYNVRLRRGVASGRDRIYGVNKHEHSNCSGAREYDVEAMPRMCRL